MRCELGRVPVTYEMFLAVTRHYGINPNWLFSGKGVQTTGRILNYDAIAGGISPKHYFSAFYKNRFSELFDKLNETASATIDDLTRMLINISTELENNPGALPPRALAKAAQIARKVVRSVEKMRKIGAKSRRRVRR